MIFNGRSNDVIGLGKAHTKFQVIDQTNKTQVLGVISNDFIPQTFRYKDISSHGYFVTWHFVLLTNRQIDIPSHNISSQDISSIWQFVTLTIRHIDNSSHWQIVSQRFCHMLFCHIDNSSHWHFATWHFVTLTICQTDKLFHRDFVIWHFATLINRHMDESLVEV